MSVDNPLFKTMSDKGWLIKDRRSGETYRYQWDMSCFGEVLTPLPDSGIVDFYPPRRLRLLAREPQTLVRFGCGHDQGQTFGEQIEDEKHDRPQW